MGISSEKPVRNFEKTPKWNNLELYSHFRILFRVIFKYFRDQRSRKDEKIRDQYEKLLSITLVIVF